MQLYHGIFDHGYVWAVISVPLYLFLWDTVFYILHRWILHQEQVYAVSHSLHHAFRPPTAWSGIAIDPFENFMSGLLPYLVPLFLGIPFHENSIYAVNALLMLHAELLHSACHLRYPGILGHILISPVHHNYHHSGGMHQATNFAPIFKFWDVVLGTSSDAEPFWWKTDDQEKASRPARRLSDLLHAATWKSIFYVRSVQSAKSKNAE